jgi:serine/threonine-protein kinase
VTRTRDRSGEVIAQRYQLVDVIGRGGQGTVYRAFDRWMKRPVAIKVLGSKAMREPHMVERLMREQQALSVLKGTSAVDLLDVCRGQDGELCLVMELLQGVDLDEYLFTTEQRGERMSVARVVEIFDPIVSTLETAHASGILHRDLKPANIFLLEGGGVRLLDFGLARLEKSAPLTAAGTVMGSPSFMAPEAWGGVSDLLDQRADVYSLGVILFRVLAGELPFSGTTLKEKFLAANFSELPSLREFRPELPRDADAWVASALARDREQRFGNVRALWSAFLSVFRSPAREPRASIWAAAMSAVGRIARSEPPRAKTDPRAAPRARAETLPRAASKALPNPPPPPKRAAPPPREATVELGDDEVQRIGPPPRKRRTPTRSGSRSGKK